MAFFSQYEILSKFYDSFNSHIDYSKWGEFLDKILTDNSKYKPEIVLDLGCGTGNITKELSKRGYDMIGVDLSEEMLFEAKKKKIKNALFIKQDMSCLDLYGTIDACVCCLDGLNYLQSAKKLEETLKKVNLFMIDGGIFVFDINTEYKFKNIYGNNSYIYEDDGVFCTWQNFYNEKTKKCDFDLTFFTENNDGTYERLDERQSEKCYSVKTIEKLLQKTGFELVDKYSDTDFSEVNENCEKIHFVCRAKNKNKKEGIGK